MLVLMLMVRRQENVWRFHTATSRRLCSAGELLHALSPHQLYFRNFIEDMSPFQLPYVTSSWCWDFDMKHQTDTHCASCSTSLPFTVIALLLRLAPPWFPLPLGSVRCWVQFLRKPSSSSSSHPQVTSLSCNSSRRSTWSLPRPPLLFCLSSPPLAVHKMEERRRDNPSLHLITNVGMQSSNPRSVTESWAG